MLGGVGQQEGAVGAGGEWGVVQARLLGDEVDKRDREGSSPHRVALDVAQL